MVPLGVSLRFMFQICCGIYWFTSWSLQRLISTIPSVEPLDKDSIFVVDPVAGPCHSREVTLLFGDFLYTTLQHPTRKLNDGCIEPDVIMLANGARFQTRNQLNVLTTLHFIPLGLADV